MEYMHTDVTVKSIKISLMPKKYNIITWSALQLGLLCQVFRALPISWAKFHSTEGMNEMRFLSLNWYTLQSM